LLATLLLDRLTAVMTSKAKKSKKAAQSSRRSQRRLFTIAVVGLVAIAAIGIVYLSFFSGDEDKAPSRSLRQDPVVTTEMSVAVDVVDRDYEPRDLSVPIGARVTWLFKGDEPHNVVDDRGAFESPILQKGDEWSLVLEEAGTYYYYCTLHHSMQGTLVVGP
jgi:plastocyanin